MTREEAIRSAQTELLERNLEETAAVLRLNPLLLENGLPHCAGIDWNSGPDTVLVYFDVVGQPYYVLVVVTSSPEEGGEVHSVSVSAAIRVLLKIRSRAVRPSDITAELGLQPTSTYDAATAIRRRHGSFGEINEWVYEQDPDLPGDVECKVEGLMGHLADVRPRIRLLSEHSQVRVSVVYHGWRGNAQFGGWILPQTVLTEISNLGADLEFDVYATGPVEEIGRF
jgi:hypothetical protein